MAETPTALRFPCTTGGAVERGRRRLRLLLAGPALIMLVVAIGAAASGRWFPALLALAVAALAFTTWRMSGDLEPLWLEVGAGKLAVQTRHQRLATALPAAARRLRPDEVSHLEGLASAGGVVAGSGGFDSHRLGEFDLYAGNLDNAVLVESGDDRWIVTPDAPEAFVEALGGPAKDATIATP